MPNLLARLRSRGISLPSTGRTDEHPASQAFKHRATTLSQENLGGLRESPVQRRIHPDLNSLMDEFTTPSRSSNVPGVTSTRDHVSHMEAPVLTSLTPSTRRHSIGEVIQPHDYNGVGSASVSQEQLDKDGAPSTSGHRWSTFGRGWGKGRDPPALGDFGTFFPTSSGEIHSSGTESRPQTPTTTSHSHSTPHSDAVLPRSQGQIDPSRSPQQTFGIPTPPSSGMSSGPRQHILVDSPPPLPPLTHPAFGHFEQLDPETRIALSASDFRYDRDTQNQSRPRLSSSLPTLRAAKSNPSRPEHRRAKTQPRYGSKFVSQLGSNTGVGDILGRFQGPAIRRKTPGKRGISRRFSAEHSSAQAVAHPPRLDEGIGGPVSWEAQVSQEMVMMSLNPSTEKTQNIIPANEQGTGVSRSRQARGHNSIGDGLDTPAPLEPSFLLQDSPSHNLSGILSDNNSAHSRLEASTRPKDNNMTGSTASTDQPSRDKGKTRETSTSGSLSKNGGRQISSTTTMQSRSSSPPRVNLSFGQGVEQGSSSHLMPPILSFTAATPQPSPISPILQNQSKSLQGSASVLKIPSASLVQRSTSEGSSKGKRKADEAGVGGGGGTPPKEGREHRATFAADPRPHRVSNNSSRAPSSYHRKRARLSTTPESRPGSRDGSIRENTNAANTGSWSSRGSPKRAASSHHQSTSNLPQRTPSRRSLSQTSIPMSALISPHAPSISRSSTFHMRDPRKPAPIQSTPWSLSLPDTNNNTSRWSFARWVERGGSPLLAWLFFFGFLIFPIWWVAAFMTTPKTRRLDGGDAEKGVVLDDPQVEFDAKSWRTRCRVMAVVSLFTYVPFIVLVAIFAPR